MKSELPIGQVGIVIGSADSIVPNLQPPLAEGIFAIELRERLFRLVIQFTRHFGEGNGIHFAAGQQALQAQHLVGPQSSETEIADRPARIISVTNVLLHAVELDADFSKPQPGWHDAIKFAPAAIESDRLNFGSRQRPVVNRQLIDIAPEWFGGLAAASIANGYTGTESRIKITERRASCKTVHGEFDWVTNQIG